MKRAMDAAARNLTFKIPGNLQKNVMSGFCPGCDHGVAIRLIAEALEELELSEKTIVVSSIGCSVFLNDYLNLDIIEAPHGRAVAAATGVKRSKPDKFVLTYQGDGDFASIGLAESLHGILRAENITAICANNINYGMTGGQASPTTVLGQVTTTTQQGKSSGFPVKIAELCASLEGAAYVERVSLTNIKQIENAKRAFKNAFKSQVLGLGTSVIEIISNCPTNWKLTPEDSHKKIDEEITKIFPLGVYKNTMDMVC